MRVRIASVFVAFPALPPPLPLAATPGFLKSWLLGLDVECSAVHVLTLCPPVRLVPCESAYPAPRRVPTIRTGAH